MYDVTCTICGKVYPYPRNLRVRYCSEECTRLGKRKRDREQYKRKKHNIELCCSICGKNVHRNTEYLVCSRECLEEKKKRNGWIEEKKIEEKIYKCKRCKKEFTSPTICKYCSPLCRKEVKVDQDRERYIRIKEDLKRKRDSEKGIKDRISISKKPCKKGYNKVCLACGEDFISTRKNILTCSPECQKDRSRELKRAIYKKNKLYPIERTGNICKTCQRSFDTDGVDTDYCSKFCFKVAYYKNELNGTSIEFKPTDYFCEHCTERIVRIPNNKKYCSKKCKEDHRRYLDRKRNDIVSAGFYSSYLSDRDIYQDYLYYYKHPKEFCEDCPEECEDNSVICEAKKELVWRIKDILNKWGDVSECV